jgi:hypothetical protein
MIVLVVAHLAAATYAGFYPGGRSLGGGAAGSSIRSGRSARFCFERYLPLDLPATGARFQVPPAVAAQRARPGTWRRDPSGGLAQSGIFLHRIQSPAAIQQSQ